MNTAAAPGQGFAPLDPTAGRPIGPSPIGPSPVPNAGNPGGPMGNLGALATPNVGPPPSGAPGTSITSLAVDGTSNWLYNRKGPVQVGSVQFSSVQ
jgi:hypothetical protein